MAYRESEFFKTSKSIFLLTNFVLNNEFGNKPERERERLSNCQKRAD